MEDHVGNSSAAMTSQAVAQSYMDSLDFVGVSEMIDESFVLLVRASVFFV
jgi:hypothetical protein